MAFVVEVHLERALEVPAGPDRVLSLLADIPDSAAHFPDLARLTPQEGGWVWTLKKLGIGSFSIQTIYGAVYHTDRERSQVTWGPLEGVGNARVSGTWTIEPCAAGSRLLMDNHFSVDLPLPRLMRKLAETVTTRENTRLVETYLENLVTTFNGGDGRVSLR